MVVESYYPSDSPIETIDYQVSKVTFNIVNDCKYIFTLLGILKLLRCFTVQSFLLPNYQ